MERDAMMEKIDGIYNLMAAIETVVDCAKELKMVDLEKYMQDVMFDLRYEKRDLEKEVSAMDRAEEEAMYAESWRW